MYPLELNKMLILSNKSTKISFCLLFEMDTFEALDEMVLGLKRPNDELSFFTSRIEDLVSTTSEAISGLIREVLVSCGWPKSMISSRISYTRTKFFLIISSLICPKKSLIIMTTLLSNYKINDGETLNLVVATI